MGIFPCNKTLLRNFLYLHLHKRNQHLNLVAEPYFYPPLWGVSVFWQSRSCCTQLCWLAKYHTTFYTPGVSKILLLCPWLYNELRRDSPSYFWYLSRLICCVNKNHNALKTFLPTRRFQDTSSWKRKVSRIFQWECTYFLTFYRPNN